MLTPNPCRVPENHAIRSLFMELAERGLGQADVHDPASVAYVSGMMVEFIDVERVYPVTAAGLRLEHLSELMAEADRVREPARKRDHYQHLGDMTLFMLGLFPERFRRNRRALSRDLYASQGRRAYRIVADLVRVPGELAVFRRLAYEYEHYVEGLHWVRLYIRDPFFQYMFREFGIT